MKKKYIYNFTCMSFAIFAFLIMNPYFNWNTGLFNILSFFILLIGIFTMLVTNLLKINRNFLILNVFFSLLFFYYNNKGIVGINGYGEGLFWMNLIAINIYIILDNKTKRKIFKYFIYIFGISLIPAIIYHTLIFIGVNVPWESFYSNNNLKINEGGYYMKFPGAISYMVHSFSLSNFRLCGMFYEPGYTGTIIALILTINKFDFKKTINKIFLIAGILTFSLAFYVIILISIICYFLIDIRKIKNALKKYYGYIILGIAILMSIWPIVYKKIVSRLVVTNGHISGNNRMSDEFKIYWDMFNSNNLGTKIFGLGNEAHYLTNTDVLSWKILIYDRGYFMILLMIILFVLIMIIGKLNKYKFIFITVFIISLYQRPLIFNIYYFIILLGGMAILDKSYINGKDEKI